MTALKILHWSLRASAQKPVFWLTLVVALAAAPLVRLATPLRFDSDGGPSSSALYEIAFAASVLGALVAIPRTRELHALTARHAVAHRWSLEILVVVVHASAFALLSAWPSGPGVLRESPALAPAVAVTALFWAGMLRVLACLRVPASTHAPALLAVAGLMAIGIHGMPVLPLARGAQASASSLSLFTPAALAADFASISSLFVVAWCYESPLVRRS